MCKNCSTKKRIENTKCNDKKVKDDFCKYGYLLEEKYVSYHASIKSVDKYGYYYNFSYASLITNNGFKNYNKFSIKNPYLKENINTFVGLNENFKLLDFFIVKNNTKKILKLKIKCLKCKCEFETNMTSIISNNNGKIKCKKCASQQQKKKLFFEDFKKNGFEVLPFQSYKNNHTFLYCKDLTTNYIGRISLNNAQNNNKFSLYSNNDYWAYNLKITISNYDNNSIIVENKSDIVNRIICLKCVNCGIEFNIMLDSLLRGNSGFYCSICNKKKSSLEQKTEQWLIENNINYKNQYSFDDLKYKNKLLFDFAILDKDFNLTGLIECDGEQHYINKHNNRYTKNFKETQIRDNLKDEYCKNKNIPFVRIRQNYFRGIRYKKILQDFTKTAHGVFNSK